MSENAELKRVLDVDFLPRSIVETRDGTLWICIYKNETVYCLHQDGHISTVSFGCPLSDISVRRCSDQLYGASTGDKTIRKLNRYYGTVEPIFDTEETSHCLCVTEDELFIVSDTSKPLVSIYNTKGERLHRMQCDNSPNHISVFHNSFRIALACYGSGVVITDDNLWKLVTQANSELPEMDAWDVAFDAQGRLLVANEFNKKVHVLDANTGKEESVIRHDKMGLVRCLLVTANGDLVVGTDNPSQILTFKYN